MSTYFTRELFDDCTHTEYVYDLSEFQFILEPIVQKFDACANVIIPFMFRSSFELSNARNQAEVVITN